MTLREVIDAELVGLSLYTPASFGWNHSPPR